jgi:hypothetical protein
MTTTLFKHYFLCSHCGTQLSLVTGEWVRCVCNHWHKVVSNSGTRFTCCHHD